MKIHEYQGKQILARYGVTVPRGEVVESAEQVRGAVEKLGLPVVVKAQIHAGGRGKGGGVKLVRTAGEVGEVAGKMLGMTLVTHQTGPEGRVVQTLLIEEGLKIKQEFYLGIVLDRATSRLVFMASSAGGMDIEEVAAKTPEKILKEYIDPALGLQAFQARKLAFGLGLAPELVGKASKFVPPHRGGRTLRARRQGHLRRQRTLPAQGLLRPARPQRGGAARDRGLEVRSQLYQARRQHRVHG
jgi:succinyl-CoA synthetase beta subunit